MSFENESNRAQDQPQDQTPDMDTMVSDLSPEEQQEVIDFITSLWERHPEAMKKLR